jgi:hypothetical protein
MSSSYLVHPTGERFCNPAWMHRRLRIAKDINGILELRCSLLFFSTQYTAVYRDSEGRGLETSNPKGHAGPGTPRRATVNNILQNVYYVYYGIPLVRCMVYNKLRGNSVQRTT